MPVVPLCGANKKHSKPPHFSRSLSSLETWGFGFGGHIAWIGTAPIINAALGTQALFVWLPGVIVSILLNLQVQRLGRYLPEVVGGTPNYAARLLSNYPGLSRYVAIGYFIGWVSMPAMNAIILTELIKTNLEPLGIYCPEIVLKIVFTCVAFSVAFSGTRALGILHLFFIIPAIAFLLAFCFQGLYWLTFSPTSPGIFPDCWWGKTRNCFSLISFKEWAMWYFIATYSIYGCESAACFVADSQSPFQSLRFLTFSAKLIPLVYLGGSWVLIRLNPFPNGDNTLLNLLQAATPFWGQSAAFLVTLLIAFSCLLSCATAVAICPRILYQLALDGYLSPVFATVSRRGVMGPALLFTFLLSLFCLVWGDLPHVLMLTGTGWLLSIAGVHLGLWLRRGNPEVRWPWWSFGFFILEVVVLAVGGLTWSGLDLLIGLLFPIAILIADVAIRQLSFPLFDSEWWQQIYATRDESIFKDFVLFQVLVLILLVCGATTIGWLLSAYLNRSVNAPSADLLVVVLITLSFIAVAIACWTTLPQIAAIDEAREQAKNLFITTLNTVPDPVLILDQNGIICRTNASALELFEMSSQQLVGYNLNQLLHPLTGKPEQWSTRSEYKLKANQRLLTVESTISQPSNCKLQEYVVILRNITERKQTESELSQYRGQLEQLVKERTTELNQLNKQLQQDIIERKRVEEQLLHTSLHDELTGLPNQALFMERLRLAHSRAKQQKGYLFAVLFLDLDRFKVVNDSLGHLLGNQLLIAFSRRLEAVVRSRDTIARLGGDEFTILLEEIEGIGAATQVAERIQNLLAKPFHLNEHEVFTSASIGIALSATGYDQPAHILRDADVAMYRAKALGKMRYEVFDTSMHKRALLLLQLETDLRHALNREEFHLYYQPIVSLVDSKITGFEALLRWHHPERGVISPLEFIPIAEETGMIVAIGQWVLFEACRQMHVWHKQFPNIPPLTLSVNFSRKQLVQPDLIKQIKQILQETGLDANSLKLEITESLLMDNTEFTNNILSQLTDLNIELQMDDFGTGYSSLSYLHRLPISTLKIDRSFIGNMGSCGENIEIVRAIVTLAHSLNMYVTAEGIETLEQLAQLRALQCDYGQGYFFSKALEAAVVEKYLRVSPFSESKVFSSKVKNLNFSQTD